MEEDIKVLEEYIKEQKEFIKQFNLEEIEDGTEGQRRIQAIENLINRNKELEEENLKLHTEIAEIVYWESSPVEQIKQDYIPKSKVREKIKELEKQMEKDEVDDFGIHSIGWSALDYIVDYLRKELLQEGDDK